MNIPRAWLLVFVLVLLTGGAPSARAGNALGFEWWFGGGFHDPDYHDGSMVIGRGGAGAVLFGHVELGANVQVDRDRWFGFGYAGLVLPAIGSLEPYGRLHAGRRDDTSDNAQQWSAGLRYGIPEVKFYLEVFHTLEPGDATGMSFGLLF